MRGVGQTKNLIYTLPNERCMIITHMRETGKEIEKNLINIRGKDFSKKVKILTISGFDDLNKMMGYNHLIFFDHAFFEFTEREVAIKALEYAEGAAISYHNNKGNLK